VTSLTLDADTFAFVIESVADVHRPLLESAFDRYRELTFPTTRVAPRVTNIFGDVHFADDDAAATATTATTAAAAAAAASSSEARLCPAASALRVRVTNLDETQSPQVAHGVDESYTLVVAAAADGVDACAATRAAAADGDDACTATLTATTVWGALRGLETFAQLVEQATPTAAAATATADEGMATTPVRFFTIARTPLTIGDAPRFPWRGVLLDTARHFLPVHAIMHVLDGMAYNKMNVLHWHITDSESFPIEIPGHPELSGKGAYAGASTTYTAEQVRSIIGAANQRGIRVMPEIDSPGHMASVWPSHPNTIADCWKTFARGPGHTVVWPDEENIALDVTKAETFKLVADIFRGIVDLFVDDFVHIGGDEVNTKCWASVPSMLAWMKENGYMMAAGKYDFTRLQGDWSARIELHVNSLGRRPVAWQEVYTAAPAAFQNTTVYNAWKDMNIQAPVDHGLDVVVSTGYYLDRSNPSDDKKLQYNFELNWKEMYKTDPVQGLRPGSDEKRVLGGELSAWAENFNELNIDERLWARGPAASERFWSPRDATDTSAATPRLESFRCKLARRGMLVGPTAAGHCPLPPPMVARLRSVWANAANKMPPSSLSFSPSPSAFISASASVSSSVEEAPCLSTPPSCGGSHAAAIILGALLALSMFFNLHQQRKITLAYDSERRFLDTY
jgi:hexosaminidase